jgi:iron complex outermembrane receptor protein
MRNNIIAAFVAAAVAQAIAPFAVAAEEINEVVVTGTRVANRSALDTAVPVDVVSAETLTNLGVSEISQALSVALPSYNFPRPGLTDGSDTVRPATLRGLAPDQTLVLVNGKRRHSAALVNINGTVGRGSSAVDLNTIPGGALRSIEVLRDGSSAQYGSDAIAGVINLRLRQARTGGELVTSYGWRDTSYTTPTPATPAGATWSAPAEQTRDRKDGQTVTVSGWKGFALGESGFLTVAAEYKNQKRTERGGWDPRSLYPKIGAAFDPREVTINRYDAWYGEPEMKQSTLFANAGGALSDGVEWYGWASFQDRDAVSAGNFRWASDPRNVIQIYPDGFLPKIAPKVTDYAATGGVRWNWAGWDMDSSLDYGRNKMMYTIIDTLNRSIGPTSKTSFDAGGFAYDQLVFNLGGVHQYSLSNLASPLNVAVGLEARREGYSITAGEADSWRNGGVLLALGAAGCTAPTATQTAAGGCATASGAQVFPGFRPANAGSYSRNSVGGYLDVEANITDKLLASAAVRAEHYSDFGSNTSGKLAARYDFVKGLALRASASTGFRAPSLQQQYFATTSTNFINGVPFDVTTFPVTDPVAKSLGALPLSPEKSRNMSVGAVFQYEGINVTVDAYRINVDNRIVLSENLTAANVISYLTAQGFVGSGGGRFFINGVDTTTKGVDVVASYALNTDAAGRFDLTATANFNETSVDALPAIPLQSVLTPAPVLFARVNILTFEQGTPKDKFSYAVNWKLNRWGATLRATRYGEVLSPGTVATSDVVLTPKTLIDIEGRVELFSGLKLAIGADNVTDKYPDPAPAALNTSGVAAFSNYSPFGRSGRFVYGRLSYDF